MISQRVTVRLTCDNCGQELTHEGAFGEFSHTATYAARQKAIRANWTFTADGKFLCRCCPISVAGQAQPR
jgi:hypothetical protein